LNIIKRSDPVQRSCSIMDRM